MHVCRYVVSPELFIITCVLDAAAPLFPSESFVVSFLRYRNADERERKRREKDEEDRGKTWTSALVHAMKYMIGSSAALGTGEHPAAWLIWDYTVFPQHH